MQLPIIKQLAETHSLETLKAAEESLYNEQQPAIEIGGMDEGEKLTHVLAAIHILEDVKKGQDLRTAIRNYTQRVRNSIN
jgi:homoserine dehydrogenase